MDKQTKKRKRVEEEEEEHEEYDQNEEQFEDEENELSKVEEEDNIEENEQVDELIDENLNSNVLPLTIIAGTYDSKVCGWRYYLDPHESFEDRMNQLEKQESLEVKDTQNSIEKEEETSKNEEDEENKMDEEEEERKEMVVEYQSLEPVFATKPHFRGPVNCIATAPTGYALSGGYDEKLFLYDIIKQEKSGILHKNSGSICTVQIFGNYVFMGTSTGAIACHKMTKDWDCYWHEEKAHKGQVLSLSIHPSGRLALSTGTDRKIKMWNLMNGTCVFSTRLSTVAEIIQWAPDGSTFAVVIKSQVIIYKTEDLSIDWNIKSVGETQNTIKCIKYLNPRLLATGGDNKAIGIYDLSDGSFLHKLEIHESRIKAIDSIEVQEGIYLIASVCSAGNLALWKVSKDFVTLEAFEDTGARFTSVGLVCPGLSKVKRQIKKRKKKLKIQETKEDKTQEIEEQEIETQEIKKEEESEEEIQIEPKKEKKKKTEKKKMKKEKKQDKKLKKEEKK